MEDKHLYRETQWDVSAEESRAHHGLVAIGFAVLAVLVIAFCIWTFGGHGGAAWEFEADDALPNLWVLYHQFRRIEKQTVTPVPRSSSKLIKVVGELRPSVTSRVPAESQIPQVPVQLELPGGARLTFATEAPEQFAAALIRRTSEFVR